MALVRVAKKSEVVGGYPFGLEDGKGMFSNGSTVTFGNAPTDSTGAYGGNTWFAIVNVTSFTTATSTGDISTNIAIYEYDDSDNSWTAVSTSGVRAWDITNCEYILVKQLVTSSGAKVYFS